MRSAVRCSVQTQRGEQQVPEKALARWVQAGLKTGMYYLRTRAAADAIKFTVDQQALAKKKAERAAKASDQAAPAVAAPLKVRATLPRHPLPPRAQPPVLPWPACPDGGRARVQERNGSAGQAAPARAAAKDPDMEKERQLAAMVCSLENKDDCLMCGS